MRKLFIILLFICSSLYAAAQYLPLYSNKDYAIYLNLGSAYQYNLYEHSRAEANFYFVTPNGAQNKPQLQLSAYGAYGFFDRGFKYGAKLAVQLPGTMQWKPFVSFRDDIAQAGSIRLGNYELLTPEFNVSFVASYFSHIRELQVGVSGLPLASLTTSSLSSLQFSLSARMLREWSLFGPNGLLYPHLYDEDEPSHFIDFLEAHIRMDWNGWSLDVLGGAFKQDAQSLYIRTILQYNNRLQLSKKSYMRIFGQAGWVSQGATASRMFDLSGTRGTYYYFYNSLLTIRPNYFYTDRFVRTSVAFYPFGKLWDLSLTHPEPFVQLGAAYAPAALNMGLDNGTYLALLEPAIGFDGLLRWGVLDIGAAIAYQLAPTSAFNYSPEPYNNYALTVIAKLIM